MKTTGTAQFVLMAATATLISLGGGGTAVCAPQTGADAGPIVVSAQAQDGAAAQDVLRAVFASVAPTATAPQPSFRLEGDAATARIGSLRATGQPLATVLRLVCRAATPRLAVAMENGVYVFRIAPTAATIGGTAEPAEIAASAITPPPHAVSPAPPSDNFIVARDGGDAGRYETIQLLYADVVDLATALPLRILPIGSRAGGVFPSGIGLWGFGAAPPASGGAAGPGGGGGAPSGAGGPPSGSIAPGGGPVIGR